MESFKKDRRRLTTRLRINLQSYFPGFSRIFRDITKPVLPLLLFLESPTKLRSLSLDSFLAGIQSIRWSEKRKIQIYENLNYESPEYETSRQSECIVYTMHLIEQINLLDHQIAKMNSDIESLYNNHSGSRILSSIPAMGTMIGATLLAELSDESRGFRDYRAFQAYAGTSPVSRQSGKSQKLVVMRRACNKHLRHALYWLAFNSLTRGEWARQFYDAQRAKGKANSVTLRSLSNKWAKIIFTIWKKNSTYSADLFKKTSIHKILLT
ncbi:IS110 family transposase [Leptospira ilyithenensis]|uniref:IS110 family transposase n=1 Tax=Leptospira ilyithenensis TaxID=2484901 RepID=A0A4R9LX15_9LEPT|nr:IS110 family transposase [Leptospira ilyithenensis]